MPTENDLKRERDETSKALQHTLGIIANLAKDNRRLLAELDQAKDRIDQVESELNSIKPGPDRES